MSSDGKRVAVVTGASSGIGKVTADLLSKQGITTIGLSRRVEDTHLTRRCDVRDEQLVRAVFGDIIAGFGHIDILINCAGIVSQSDPLAVPVEEWDAVLRTNLVGTYLCCKHAIPTMSAQRFGRIVNVSSIAGRSYSRTASIAYTCSKYAVVGLTRQLAASFGREGITINCVCPSQTKSEMLLTNVAPEQIDALVASIPVGRLAEPEEVAQVICFLASDAASYINGAAVDVNGGQI